MQLLPPMQVTTDKLWLSFELFDPAWLSTKEVLPETIFFILAS